MSLFFVFLRKPVNLDDQRSDPFWEFGSFGRTGCHSKNLLHPRHCPLTRGDRLAFLQGGNSDIRVVGVTPPIIVGGSSNHLEATWNRKYRPLPFDHAPLLIDNLGKTAFPSILPLLTNVRRSTYCGRAGSRLRSRTMPVDPKIEQEILQWFDQPRLATICNYVEAIETGTGRWVLHAQQLGWADLRQRRNKFNQMVGFQRKRC